MHAFAKLKYVGTLLDNNRIVSNGGRCVTGLDNAGTMIATTSSVFNRMIKEIIKSNNTLKATFGAMSSLILNPANFDVAFFKPNPFKNYENPTFKPSSEAVTKQNYLALVDGALGDENIALWPLINKDRNIDVLIVPDASNESTKRWPSGKAMGSTYNRATGYGGIKVEEGFYNSNAKPKHIMAKVPDENSFINLGLTTRPTFFGCYASDYMTNDEMLRKDFSRAPPLIIYVANTPISHMSNMDTFKMSMDKNLENKMFRNGFDLAQQEEDKEWSKCVACAVIQRERERKGLWDPTDECETCFERYCWDGTTDNRDYNQAKLHNDPKLGNR